MSNIKVHGLYVYQPLPASEKYIYGVGGVSNANTWIKGLSKYEAEQIILLLNKTRGEEINKNTLKRMNKEDKQ